MPYQNIDATHKINSKRWRDIKDEVYHKFTLIPPFYPHYIGMNRAPKLYYEGDYPHYPIPFPGLTRSGFLR
uniref:Uncharacterized protein n=1 Tax=Candidatus Kentrum sp. TC TaxID=2126339 RepID=A0A450Z1D9_9GAMM|nr:MAG: hypothetical protein BECKTC1821E_GA0114239_10882 [Candidatus Kentron sp. TC]